MVLILFFLKRTNQPELFKPWLFSSQPCEGFFRLIRSFSPCYSQVTNCTVKEMLHRIHRIQLQNDISNDPSTNFKFPKKLKADNHPQTIEFELPNEADILNEIEECRTKAINDAIKIGLINNQQVDLECCIVPYSPFVRYKRRKYSRKEHRNVQSCEEVLEQLEHTSLKNFAELFGDEPLDETSQYTEIYGSDSSKRIIVKKMSLCWLLRKEEKKLSSDRLLRVRNTPLANKQGDRHKNNKIRHFPNGYIRGKHMRNKSAKRRAKK